MAKIDIDRFNAAVTEKRITKVIHPEFPYLIWNYTPMTQYGRDWDDITVMCRGLITTTDGEIVARPFAKFFNLEELGPEWKAPSDNFEVTTKEDGSLGIMYPTPTGRRIATRGSFLSDQAIHANEVMVDWLQDPRWQCDRITYLFEIIYPQNRIVINYGDLDHLVLLAAIDIETGRDVALPEWYSPQVKKVMVEVDEHELIRLKEADLPNSEGYVICFEDGFRVKIKFENYVTLHRILTGLSKRSIWELLMAHPSDAHAALMALYDVLQLVPEEFTDWARKSFWDIVNEHTALMAITKVRWEQYDGDYRTDRKRFAAYATRFPDISSYLFICLDNFLKTGDILSDRLYLAVLKAIKPRADSTYTVDVDG